jgi:hypothetical protein
LDKIQNLQTGFYVLAAKTVREVIFNRRKTVASSNGKAFEERVLGV